jgi:DNA-binding transcriptional regulator YdaS (Cro superfamily)
MNKSDAIAKAGSITQLARLLGISHQAVSKWGDKMPLLQVYRLREIKPRWFRKAASKP